MPGRPGYGIHVPSVVHGLPKTEEGVRQAFLRYQQANADLPQKIQHYLGIAAIARYFTARRVESALGIKVPKALLRDLSWRYWNILLYTGLHRYWNGFKEQAEARGARMAARWLRKRISHKRYLLFLARVGTNPNNLKVSPRFRYIWTKGGMWDTRSNMTLLLVRKKPLPPRVMSQRWQQKLGHAGVELLEKELMQLIDPDVMLMHEAKYRAVEYLQHRIPQLIRWKQKLGPMVAAWFFGCAIPNGPKEEIRWVGPSRRLGYIERRSSQAYEHWSWM